MESLLHRVTVATTVVSVLIGVGLPASNAFAVDSKITAGNMCHGQSEFDERNIFHYWDFLAVYNDLADVVCPVIRDRRSNENGTSSFFVRVYVPDGETLFCTLDAWNQFHTISVHKAGSASGPGNKTINLDLASSKRGGAYTVRCAVPPLGRIYSIRSDEFNPTDTN
jgi:hypothetical protein